MSAPGVASNHTLCSPEFGVFVARQHTLGGAIDVQGTGLHSGSAVRVSLRPTAAATGVMLVRDDIAGAEPIPVHVDRVVEGRFATSLGTAGWRVSTVEHLLAALLAAHVDNVVIGVSGPEVPVFDGSAAPWLEHIARVGLAEQQAPRRALRLTRRIEVRDGDRYASAEPAEELRVSARIEYPHPLIGVQELSTPLSNGQFEHDIAWARTFGFLAEVEALRASGLIRGGTLDNAVVYAPDGTVVNEGGLRRPDEAVRHKVLDMIGDLALLGHPLIAHVRAELPGHSLTHDLVRAIQAEPGALEQV